MVDLQPPLAPRRSFRRSKTLIAAIGALGLLGAAWPYNALMLRVVLADHLGDFGRLYYAARQFNAGRSMYAESPVPIGVTGTSSLFNLNPPHAHLPFLALAPLPEQVVFAIGLALAFAAFLACVRMGLAAAGERRWRFVLAAAFVAPAFAAAQALLGTGQFFAWWLALPAALAWRAARRDRWTRAGAWLGLLAATKIFALLFVPYLALTRRWRALLVLGCVFASSFAAGIAVFGWPAYVEWFRSLQQPDWIPNRLNGSLRAWLERVMGGALSAAATARDPVLAYGAVVDAGWLVRPLQYAMSGAIGLTSLWLARRTNADGAFALVLLAALLISPLGWTYYVWLAVGPLIVLAARDRRFASVAALTLPFALWPIHLMRVGQPSPLSTLTIGSGSFWTIFGLWCAAAVSAFAAPCRPGNPSWGQPAEIAKEANHATE